MKMQIYETLDCARVEGPAATVVFGQYGITWFSLIDAATNRRHVQPVAEMFFTQPVAPLVLDETVTDGVSLVGPNLRATVHADGLTLIEPSVPLRTTYRSLVRADWEAGYDAMRMFANPSCGSLHLYDGANDLRVDGDEVRGTIHEGDHLGVAVLPSRAVDQERIYGHGARPHVAVAYMRDHISLINDDPDKWLGRLERHGYGVLVLLYDLYADGYVPRVDLDTGTLAYEYWDVPAVRRTIAEAQRRGFKVLGYIQPYEFRNQDEELTRAWMRYFVDAHHLDGVYLDGLGIRAGDWLRNYWWVRNVRRDLGPDGVIYAHNSVDVFAGLWPVDATTDADRVRVWSGLTGAPALAHCDYVLSGESGEPIAAADDSRLPYVGRGFSGATGLWKPSNDSTIPRDDLWRAVGRWGVYSCGVGDTDVYPVAFADSFAASRDAWRNDGR